MGFKSVLRGIWRYRPTLIFILVPIVLLALPLSLPGKEALCGYAMILMGIYWMTEVIPLAVTSFIPLVLFPMMGIMTASTVSAAYFTDTNWLFIGGLIIAVAVETTNLHKRISLRVLTLVGAKPRCLMFGFMFVTFFLSMWISNTATTAMMLPIVEAVTNELMDERKEETNQEETNEKKEADAYMSEEEKPPSSQAMEKYVGTSFYGNHAFENDESTGSYDITDENLENASSERNNQEAKKINTRKGLTICVPYAASIGGTITVTGTGPNLVLSGQFPILFPDADIQLSFATWFIYCLPSGILFFILAYLWLSTFYLGFNIRGMFSCLTNKPVSQQEKRANEILKEEYRKLGQITWAETTVLIVFIITALLWFFRDPGFIPGWSILFEEDFVDDGTVAVFMGSTLFFLPSKRPMFLRKSDRQYAAPVPPILEWKSMQKIFPWNVVFLLGGGFALAKGSTESGLSQWLADQLEVLAGIEPWLICLIITIIVCLFTEITSNVATATLFVPILARLAQSLNIHPIYLLVPPVLATSMAFMLPVATPPNAIAFAYGHLKVLDLIKAGSVLNVLGITIVTLFINTYGMSYFNLGTMPEWAIQGNSSSLLV